MPKVALMGGVLTSAKIVNRSQNSHHVGRENREQMLDDSMIDCVNSCVKESEAPSFRTDIATT